MALANLCKKARNLPDEVKERIWYFSPPPHPTASIIKTLEFKYGPVAYAPLSSMLYVSTWKTMPQHFVTPPTCKDQRCWKYCKQFWICVSRYHPKYTDLPDWVVQEVRSPEQRKNVGGE